MANSDIPRASVPDPVSQRRRQKIFLILGALGVMGVIGALVALQERDPAIQQTREQVKTNFATSGQKLSDKEVWVAKSTEEMKKQREEQDQLRRDLDLVRRQLDVAQGKGRSGDPSTVPPPPPPPPLVSPAANRDSLMVPPGNLPPPAPGLGAAAKAGFNDLVDIDPNKKKGQKAGYNPGLISGPGAVAQAAPLPPESEIFRIEIDQPSAPLGGSDTKLGKGGKVKEDKPEKNETYLPAGSFVRGVLLAGVDAPASNQAQSNPHPVLIRLKDLATLPNRFRTNIKECFVVGAAYGDMSSERAYIRTETLSCVQKDGQVMEAKTSGYVSGEDGKTGMRGRLVTKEGQLLAKAMLAGILSGIGNGLADSYKTTSVSALGTTTTTDPGKVAESGTAQGVGNAMDRLAKYYIEMAEKTFPIIEIDAEREVEIVFTRGVTLEGTLKNATLRK